MGSVRKFSQAFGLMAVTNELLELDMWNSVQRQIIIPINNINNQLDATVMVY